MLARNLYPIDNISYECYKNDDNCVCKGLIDKVKDDKDLSIGFDPDEVIKNREELKINLIYFDENLTNSNISYNYYKKFKVNVVGVFYASDEIEIFKQYLSTMKYEEKTPPFLVVVTPQNFEEIYNISTFYNFIKEIILIDESNQIKYNNYLKTHSTLLKKIALNYNDLIYYLKGIGDMTSNWNYYIRKLFKNRIFTYDEIKMDRQINICSVITAYEYDKLYYMIHKALAHFFTNSNSTKNPRLEYYPKFEEYNLQKINEFLNEYEDEEKEELEKLKKYEELEILIHNLKIIRNDFQKLKNSQNFTEDAIRFYTKQDSYYNIINSAMRTFDNHPIKLAYFLGPFLFGLNKYVLDHPEKGLRNNITLYRYININPLDKYIYTLAVGHIICFPALTSTTILRDNFEPTNDKRIRVEMIIQYYHSDGNISPGLFIKNLSDYKEEEELLLFPFTFLRLNNVIQSEPNRCILEMEIINRKSCIEYELNEGKIFNIEDLEKHRNKPLFIEEGINYFPNTNQTNQPVNQNNNNGFWYNYIGRWFY